MRIDERRKIVVGIGFDNESKELLGWALAKVAHPHDHLLALHVSPNSEDAAHHMLLLNDFLQLYTDLSHTNKVKLTGKILTGKSIRKSLVKEAKDSQAAVAILGVTNPASIRTAKYCAKHLPPTIQVLSIHNGIVVFKRGTLLDYPHDQGELLEISFTNVIQNTTRRKEGRQRSMSLSRDTSTQLQRPGWPLLRRPSLPTQKALESRKMSVVQWVMSLPDRSSDTPQTSITNSCSSRSDTESPLSRTSCHSVSSELLMLEELALPFDFNSSNFTWFSYHILNHATSYFSPEHLIGKGGSSRVYKGVFLDGKQVAVKVLKSSKQAWKDFSLEVNIMSSLRHKNITSLLGVCIHNSELISVYDFMSKGSLDENLHVKKQKCVLSWEARFRVATGIAEAVQFLHSGCSGPVIHRDIKSSNILLSDDFEPQLSDFGLAIWGPNSSSETYTDIVGTFGYLAPEYVMYGKVSNKLDVYSFGVVLLELLSGRKPIDSSKCQESLVIWAKPILESGKLKELVDPNLGDTLDETQMQRMVLAATLCLTREARHRPSMGQILRLLNGEETAESLTMYDANEQEDGEKLDVNDDEAYQKSPLSLALFDIIEDDLTSKTRGPSLADFFKYK